MAASSSTNSQGAPAGPAMLKTGSSVSPVPQVIHELVAKFTEHRDTYKRGDYNETQLRRDFLDPFFAAMGWDIHNRKGKLNARGSSSICDHAVNLIPSEYLEPALIPGKKAS